MVSLLDRLGHSRVLARLSAAASPPAPTPASQGPGYAFEQTAWSLRPREWGRAARSFAEPLGDRPRMLGGALDRLILPGLEPMARALATLGITTGTMPVFLDGETTGLGDAVPFVLGIAFVQADRLLVEQWTLARTSAESAMLAHAFARLEELSPAPLVSFNGASFDVPLLRRRAQRHGLQADVLACEHCDLLHPARRLWSGRADNCQLGTLEREQLGVRRREDLPGHEIPRVFEAWLRAPEDPIVGRKLRAVVLHNQADLVTLPALLVRMAERIEAPSDLAMAMNVAPLLIRLGRVEQARALLERWIDATPPGATWRDALVELAELERRADRREHAAACWQRILALDPGDPEACEALAKHHEHHAGELDQALAFARRSRSPDPQRIARLERKLGCTTGSELEVELVEIAEPAPAAQPAPAEPAWRSSVALRFAPWRRCTPDDTTDRFRDDSRPTYRLYVR
jgi:tetratricopeptide (TPR) repeat protein